MQIVHTKHNDTYRLIKNNNRLGLKMALMLKLKSNKTMATENKLKIIIQLSCTYFYFDLTHRNKCIMTEWFTKILPQGTKL